ncbi:HNH endonuclease [Ferrimonas marina]|uniref:5-methylcytosine-specific restriction enzyme A n=1 Tax=Ferrimonas marina TaxID=299255 RepID=A0A1M5TYK8_9GAMM|nr:HNH endonuclease [Ferrimonas marina]SHH55774.1 5-methylcytosine-specific restriction enzyme A [Ferrimonas marina]
MDPLQQLKPTKYQTAYSLVAEAGHDVSDWNDYERPTVPAANPRYCYRWAWEQDGLIIMTVWHKNIRHKDGTIFYSNNYRADWIHSTANWPTRAAQRDTLLKRAFEENLSCRAIIIDGPSGNHKRLLDPESWFVSHYDDSTGDVTIKRGTQRFVDQFDATEVSDARITRGTRNDGYHRDPKVRTAALERAQGFCECCGTKGFRMENNCIYLESHHIIPLSEGGPDHLSNVVALCPTCHMKAHFAADKAVIAHSLQARRLCSPIT